MLSSPGRRRAANIQHEVAQDVRTERRVLDFGMKLHGEDLALRILDGCDSMRSTRGQTKSRGQFFGRIAMRHPDGEQPGESLKERRVVGLQFDFGASPQA